MKILDGFIINVFRTEKPILTKHHFEDKGVWVCDLLNQDLDLAKEFIIFKLSQFKDRIETLHFLYESRSCYKYTITDLEMELQPDYKTEFPSQRSLTRQQKIERLSRYKKAISMTDQAICHYIDCSKLDCSENSNTFQLSKKKGAKTDIIRVLNAIYELKFIEKKDGQIPTKEEFMKQTGNFWGIDLSKYDIDLSQALNNTGLEANIKIFEDMKGITQDSHYIGKKKK